MVRDGRFAVPTGRGSNGRARQGPKPWIEMRDVEGAGIENLHHVPMDLVWRTVQTPPVNSKKNVHGGEVHLFVAVDDKGD